MTWNQLAWKARPAVPDSTIETIKWLDGELEIPRYGYLTATEMQLIRDVDPSNAQIQILYRSSVELAAKINDPDNWGSVKCYGLLTMLFANINGSWKPTQEEAQVILGNKDLIEECIKKVKDAHSIVKIRTISVVLQRNTPGWTDQATADLPAALQDKIYDFANEEATAGMGEVDLAKAQQSLENDLKKLRADSRLILTDQTLPNSSGSAEDSGQGPQSLPAKTTVRSRLATSSRQSKRASKRTAGGFMKKS